MKKKPDVKDPNLKKEWSKGKKSNMKKEVETEEEPKLQKDTNVKKQPYSKKQTAKPFPFFADNDIHFPVRYEIECPEVGGQRDNGSGYSLTLNAANGKVWGSYDFRMFSGILHLQYYPLRRSKTEIPLHWRERENSEGVMSFHDYCQGVLAFLPDGKISGRMDLYGDCTFSGTRKPMPLEMMRSASSVEEEWKGYNQRAYDEENANRWR